MGGALLFGLFRLGNVENLSPPIEPFGCYVVTPMSLSRDWIRGNRRTTEGIVRPAHASP